MQQRRVARRQVGVHLRRRLRFCPPKPGRAVNESRRKKREKSHASARIQHAKRARDARLVAVGAPLGRLMTLVEHTGAKERSGEVLDVTHDGRHDSGGVGQCIAPKINRKSLILMPQIPIFRLRRPPSPPRRPGCRSGSRSGKSAPCRCRSDLPPARAVLRAEGPLEDPNP